MNKQFAELKVFELGGIAFCEATETLPFLVLPKNQATIKPWGQSGFVFENIITGDVVAFVSEYDDILDSAGAAYGATQLDVITALAAFFFELGGGASNLSSVLTVGNQSGLNDIRFDPDYGLLLDNTSRLRNGTIDAGLGGSKGIAQICGAGYELKWEAGRHYVMGSSGNTIRQSLYNFATAPGVNDDNTFGYAVGSLWTLDDGSVYNCTDATTGAAVWALQTIELNELSDVTLTAPANNDALIYESATSLWKNKTIATALGFTPVTDARTISTTSPLTGGGDLTANRTLSIPKSTSSVDGYLDKNDWVIFNGKQNALGFTPVTDARTITINGTSQDLSANRTFTIADSAGWSYIVKSANQDVTNSITLVDDTELQFSVVAGGQYMIEMDVVISANNTSGDYKNALAVSAGTMKAQGIITCNTVGAIAQVISINANSAATTSVTSIGTLVGDLDILHSIKIIYSFTASANATFKYQFANNIGGAGNVSRTFKGSILKYKKIN